MMNGILTLLPLAVLALLLAVACWTDLRERRIPNWLTLSVALLAPLDWLARGLPMVDILWTVGVAFLLFALLVGAMALGQMGGGDVKLAGALALWMAPVETLRFFIIMSLVGLPLTLATHGWHRWRKIEGPVETPYGLAIVAGAAAVLAQRFLNQFAG